RLLSFCCVACVCAALIGQDGSLQMSAASFRGCLRSRKQMIYFRDSPSKTGVADRGLYDVGTAKIESLRWSRTAGGWALVGGTVVISGSRTSSTSQSAGEGQGESHGTCVVLWIEIVVVGISAGEGVRLADQD